MTALKSLQKLLIQLPSDKISLDFKRTGSYELQAPVMFTKDGRDVRGTINVTYDSSSNSYTYDVYRDSFTRKALTGKIETTDIATYVMAKAKHNGYKLNQEVLNLNHRKAFVQIYTIYAKLKANKGFSIYVYSNGVVETTDKVTGMKHKYTVEGGKLFVHLGTHLKELATDDAITNYVLYGKY